MNEFTKGKPMLESPLRIEDVSPLPKDKVGLAVLGAPIKHSISPQLHHAALEELSARAPSFSNWQYHKIEVESKDLASALPYMARCGYRGLNLTIPHKVEVFSLLDTIDPEARNIGAVNTLKFDGLKWQGFNSDGYGLEHALLGKLEVPLISANVVVLGAGGAARAAAAQALSRGCKSLWIGNRSTHRLKELIGELRNSFDTSCVTTFEISQIPSALFKIEELVIINATALGLEKDDPSPVSLLDFPSSTKIYDMIYNPPETSLLKQAKLMGMACENGLSMLVHQAVRSLSIWTEQEISVQAMFNGARSAIPI